MTIDMFSYSVRKQIAAMIAVLGGVDLIVFTGGFGENDREVRSEICRGLDWAGVVLKDERNASSMPRPSTSRCLAGRRADRYHTRTFALRGPSR
ncbi:MAG: hypothetical protein ACREDL_23230 [Bradyrhizobium sp.]